MSTLHEVQPCYCWLLASSAKGHQLAGQIGLSKQLQQEAKQIHFLKNTASSIWSRTEPLHISLNLLKKSLRRRLHSLINNASRPHDRGKTNNTLAVLTALYLVCRHAPAFTLRPRVSTVQYIDTQAVLQAPFSGAY